MLTSADRERDFPSLANRTYLNSAAEGIPPLAVRDSLTQYFADKELGMDGRVAHARKWDEVRKLAAEFYGLSADEIGICSCASEAFNLAATALRLKPGDEVIFSDLDFPSGITPWLLPDAPCTAKVWRSREGALHVDDLTELLTPRTRLVTVSLVSFLNGFRLPLRSVVETIRQNSRALIAIDATQALGRIPLELDDVDLIVSSTHKWILASHGGGIVGIPAAKAHHWQVSAGGWFHLNDAFGPNRLAQAIVKPGAAGFAVGMPNYPAVYAVAAGLGYIRNIGVASIDATSTPLVMHGSEELQKLPVEFISPRHPNQLAGILAFRHPDFERIQNHLRSENIHVMAHAGRIRVAIHGYNTHSDVERLIGELRRMV